MAGLRDLRAGDRRDPAVVRRSRPAARRRRAPGYDQDDEDRLFERDRVAGRRLPPLRDRPLHRRPRLVRRDLGEQLPVRARARCSSRSAASTTASRCRAAATPTSSCSSGSGSSPGVTVVTILGEGSFHQVHGGTTTNDAARDERRSKVVRLRRALRELRGRPLAWPGKPIHYVGALATHGGAAHPVAPHVGAAVRRRRDDAVPTACPTAPELRARRAEDAVHRGLLAQPRLEDDHVARPPGHDATDRPARVPGAARRVRPDWIVETGTGDGGRALFLASVCDLLGHGRGRLDRRRGATDARPSTRGSPTSRRRPDEAASFAQVARARRRGRPARSSILGLERRRGPASCGVRRRYAPLVPVGLLRRRREHDRQRPPVWPGFGPGPRRGGARILATHGDFVQRHHLEKHGLTFNPGGFLRRVR